MRITVLGGGSFGTALADVLARRHQDITLWVRDEQTALHMQRFHRNPRYLSEFDLPQHLKITSHLAEALQQAELIVLATPSQSIRPLLRSITFPKVPLVLAAKGIEPHSLLTCAEIVTEVLGKEWQSRTLALSGPSFAHEMMLQQPTAVVLACEDEALAQTIGSVFFCNYFRTYTSNDVMGVELGGALKNVMAIAAGGVIGLGLGDNTRAALITRGIAEITRLAVAKGADARTLAGLAGVGDMVLTCTGNLSRNRALGFALAQGQTLEQAQQHHVVEGIVTTQSAYQMAQKLNIYAPITQAVYRVLYEHCSVKEALDEIVRRQPHKE